MTSDKQKATPDIRSESFPDELRLRLLVRVAGPIIKFGAYLTP